MAGLPWVGGGILMRKVTIAYDIARVVRAGSLGQSTHARAVREAIRTLFHELRDLSVILVGPRTTDWATIFYQSMMYYW